MFPTQSESDLRSPEKLRELLAETIEKGPEPPRFFHLWRLLGWTCGAIFAALFLDYIGSSIWRASNPDQPSSAELNGALASLKLIIELVVASLVLMIGLRVNGHQAFAYLGFTRPVIGRTAVILSGIVILYLTCLIGLTIIVGPPAGVVIYRQWYQSAATLGALPLLWVAFVIAAPVCEEIIFRGFFFRALSVPLRGRWVVVLTSLLWALIHWPANTAFLIFVFLLGLVLGSIRHVTGSIVPTIMLHLLTNTVVLTVFGMGTGPTPQGWHRQHTHEGGFSVAFPKIPEYRPEQRTNQDGGTYTVHQYVVRRGRDAFFVLTRTTPGVVVDARAALQSVADTTPNFAYESQTWRTVKGVDALETVSVRNDRRIRALLMVTNQGFITAQHSAALDAVESPDIEAFITSVRPEN